MTFGEADPSQPRGGAGQTGQTSVPGKVTFSRRELDPCLCIDAERPARDR